VTDDESSHAKRGHDTLGRRDVLASLLVAAATGAVACTPQNSATGQSTQRERAVKQPKTRMPVAFLPHGGGPWPILDFWLPRDERASLLEHLREVPKLSATTPAALLVLSAHWEAPVPTVMSSAKPPMLYDYSGFPPEAYTLTWPAPGSPILAGRVRELLAAAGFSTAEDTKRGYDHGTFVPLKVAFPEANIPVVQLSLIQGLDPNEHLKMGRALEPLRDEGVLIIGSGNSFHNMRVFREEISAPASVARDRAAKFDAWLQAAVAADPAVRDERLRSWEQAPFGRYAHPREEHLIPLMFVAGAAGGDRGTTTWSGSLAGLKVSGFHFAT
jgi:aromatic ring-opening dioxygenase catalytic subunit (LigB family)